MKLNNEIETLTFRLLSTIKQNFKILKPIRDSLLVFSTVTKKKQKGRCLLVLYMNMNTHTHTHTHTQK